MKHNRTENKSLTKQASKEISMTVGMIEAQMATRQILPTTSFTKSLTGNAIIDCNRCKRHIIQAIASKIVATIVYSGESLRYKSNKAKGKLNN